ncbi:unnamed protein product [Pleuronectes platessa]|uniref:Uncharacterized protein n=1 Tax=Pleuronectes platessa TaxID=8262 RepID=A0A9N7TKV7_PLEPL|nr:unnamed protein product [Pleuronectes platessa]
MQDLRQGHSSLVTTRWRSGAPDTNPCVFFLHFFLENINGKSGFACPAACANGRTGKAGLAGGAGGSNPVDPRLRLASIRRPPSADEEDSVKYLQILIFPVVSCSGFSPGSWIRTGEERGADQPSISWGGSAKQVALLPATAQLLPAACCAFSEALTAPDCCSPTNAAALQSQLQGEASSTRKWQSLPAGSQRNRAAFVYLNCRKMSSTSAQQAQQAQ